MPPQHDRWESSWISVGERDGAGQRLSPPEWKKVAVFHRHGQKGGSPRSAPQVGVVSFLLSEYVMAKPSYENEGLIVARHHRNSELRPFRFLDSLPDLCQHRHRLTSSDSLLLTS